MIISMGMSNGSNGSRNGSNAARRSLSLSLSRSCCCSCVSPTQDKTAKRRHYLPHAGPSQSTQYGLLHHTPLPYRTTKGGYLLLEPLLLSTSGRVSGEVVHAIDVLIAAVIKHTHHTHTQKHQSTPRY